MVCAKDARQVTKEPQSLGKTLVRRQRLVKQYGYVDVATGVRTSGCLGTEEVNQSHGVLLEKTLQWLTEGIQVHACFFPVLVPTSYACVRRMCVLDLRTNHLPLQAERTWCVLHIISAPPAVPWPPGGRQCQSPR